MTSCTVCSGESRSELSCRRCDGMLHFRCALGFDPPEEFKVSDLKAEYLCAPCLVGTSYELLHRALDAHRRCKPPSITNLGERADTQTSSTAPDVNGHLYQPGYTPTAPTITQASYTAPDICGTVYQPGYTPTAPSKTPSRRRRKRKLRHTEDVIAEQYSADGIGNAESVDQSVGGDSVDSVVDEVENVVSDVDGVTESANVCEVGLAEIHTADIVRAKRTGYIINTVKNFPHHVTTLSMGDSNMHGIDGKEVDAEGNTVNVRSVGGLCVIAAVTAMQQHNGKYPRIKRVSWSLGTNDILHQSQHRVSERSRYLKLLYMETKRIFPQAEVIFILPFNGMEKVSAAYIRELASDIKANCPNMKILHPPSMRHKLGRDGIHLNR